MNDRTTKKDGLFPSRYIYNDSARETASQLHEIDNYRMACEWYKKHLLQSIYNLSPIDHDPSLVWEDDYDASQYWCDQWVDALVQGIELNNQTAFYCELESNSWATPKLVDAFKKLEAIYKLENILARKDTNTNLINEFQNMLKTQKETLIARRRDGGALDTFVRMLGVACAAILGLAGLGIGAYFAGKAAQARLFRESGTTGSEFVAQVEKPGKR